MDLIHICQTIPLRGFGPGIQTARCLCGKDIAKGQIAGQEFASPTCKICISELYHRLNFCAEMLRIQKGIVILTKDERQRLMNVRDDLSRFVPF